MSGSGIVRGSYYEPHVYFIFSKTVVYIGETQNIPIRRWSSHLDSNGSFCKNLKRHLGGLSNQDYLNGMSFYSFSCKNELSDIQLHYCGYRIPTQALEHRLHEIVLSKLVFGNNISVISETTKTAPRNFYHWDDIDRIAVRLINKMLYFRDENSSPVFVI
ncbi:GIY-YIG nuclease family protein [Rheinheimera baltica]|uniref:GIY-YIG nuclease family protein n=1 Tax=Rheinheimera baltica TaxID=67576 RepID=UPI000488EF69